MNDELTWNVGQEAAAHGSLKQAPAKAYFYWKRGDQVVRSEEYTYSELEAEIKRLEKLGEETAEFKRALKRLALYQGAR